MRRAVWVVVCVAAVAAGALSGCSEGSDSNATGDSSQQQTGQSDATSKPRDGGAVEVQAEGGPTSNTIPDGHWQRGADFQPGTYRAPGGQECEWAQSDSLEGIEVGSGNTHYGTNLLVNIGDKYFRTEGCGVWQKQGSAAAGDESGAGNEADAQEGGAGGSTTISDGHWQKDTDYEVGLYRAPGGEECEWAQAESPNGVEAGSGNTFYGVNLLVEIEAQYFRTEGCGEWHLAKGGPEGSDVPTATTIPDGHWRRETDFQPGTYRAKGGEECEWAQGDSARQVEAGSGNTHYGRNLLAELTAEFIRTEGCGVWEKTG